MCSSAVTTLRSAASCAGPGRVSAAIAPAEPTLSIGLPAGLRSEVDAYARRHRILPQEALRYLIEAGLTAEAHAMWVAARLDAPAG